MSTGSDLQHQFGGIDIYLFDQLLRGRIRPGTRVVDAGCGSGRNLVFFLREGYEVFATDADLPSIEGVRRLAAELAPQLPDSNFRFEPVEHMSFDDGMADVVISSAVLHFARDDRHFGAMVQEMWRQIEEVHPALSAWARFLNRDTYRLGRLQAELRTEYKRSLAT